MTQSMINWQNVDNITEGLHVDATSRIHGLPADVLTFLRPYLHTETTAFTEWRFGFTDVRVDGVITTREMSVDGVMYNRVEYGAGAIVHRERWSRRGVKYFDGRYHDGERVRLEYRDITTGRLLYSVGYDHGDISSVEI